MLLDIKIKPYVPRTKRRFNPKVPLYEIVDAILYKLKTGIQWEFLPVESLFKNEILHYKTVFGHYRKWCELDVWKPCWIDLLKANKSKLDLSSGDLDGSHTTALRGGQEVGSQGRKKHKTTNAIYLTDRQRLPLAMSEPVSGNHNDLFDIEVQKLDFGDSLRTFKINNMIYRNFTSHLIRWLFFITGIFRSERKLLKKLGFTIGEQYEN